MSLPTRSAAHNLASIDARLELRGARADLLMRLDLRDLRHLVEVDADADGRLTPAEVLATRDAVAELLAQSLRLVAEPDTTSCPVHLAGFKLADFSTVDVHLRFSCSHAIGGATLHSGLFGGTGHRYQLHLVVTRGDWSETLQLDDAHNRAVLSAPPAAHAVAWWLGLCSLAVAVAAGLLLWVRRDRKANGPPASPRG
ncbi:MAG: hypothetical protein ABIJ09_15720 [Pseudomonadota bacterium]